MRYAVISDIHGNLPVLEAVLADAQNWGAEGYLFLGDYIGEFPWPNEVISLLRTLPNAHFVRGNREEYAKTLLDEGPETWVWQQMATFYWNMWELTKENLAFLRSLPKIKKMEVEGHKFFLAHRLEDFLPKKVMPLMIPRNINKFAGSDTPVKPEEITGHFIRQLSENPKIEKMFIALPEGVYLFGHNHMPWVATIWGKSLVNPGAIGIMLDKDVRGSYIRLTTKKEQVLREIIRIPYDIGAVAQGIRVSGLYQAAGDWAEITIKTPIRPLMK